MPTLWLEPGLEPCLTGAEEYPRPTLLEGPGLVPSASHSPGLVSGGLGTQSCPISV